MFESLANYREVTIVQSDDYLSDLCRFTINGKVLLVTSQGFSHRGVVGDIIKALGAERVIVFDKVTPNPEKTFIQEHHHDLVSQGITNILAIGGGSVIDTAKVFSAMFSYADQTLEQLLSRHDLHCQVNLIAVPTTSGTGAEVTPFATVWESKTNTKLSLSGIKPKVAILDSRLTLTLPDTETLYPALDALSHALESLWNKNRTQASENYAISAIKLICEALPRVLADSSDYHARKKLQQAATLAGLAISITKTALAHAISYPLTSRYGVPHGLASSFTLLAILSTQCIDDLAIPVELSLALKQLLKSLELHTVLTKYADYSQIRVLYQSPLDYSRVANFITPVDQRWVQDIVNVSLSPSCQDADI